MSRATKLGLQIAGVLVLIVVGLMVAYRQIPAGIYGNGTVPQSIGGVAVNPVTDKTYIANFSGNSVTVVDGATNFWVGQDMTFQAGFVPALPESPVYDPVKWSFDGVFKNEPLQECSGGFSLGGIKV